MRIACVHIPQLSLQCVTRVEPSLSPHATRADGKTAALVVAGSSGDARAGRAALTAPIVVAVSRAAWALGVRLGMTAVAARGVSNDVRVVHADAGAERELARALADALMAISPTVDIGGRLGAGGAHLAMYLEVPAKLRGASFGDRVVEVIESLGLTGRVGIADDRFTAWVAASSPGTDGAVTSVPRGGAAAYLASKPLSLLAITAEVQHMLEALGVRTLGEFASLPAPSVARPIDRDYQALARGEGGTSLRPYAPEAAVREEISLGGIEAGLNNVDAVAEIAKRVALRLGGRGRVASRVEVMSIGGWADGHEKLVTIMASEPGPGGIDAVRPHVTDDELAEAIGGALAPGAWRVRVTVTGEALIGEVGGDAAAVPAPIVAAASAPMDLLGVVLANTGTGDLFGGDFRSASLSAAAAAPYRRTRRGKQRRRLTLPQQPRLFERS
jgi:hypothetical protein|nr:hypothetical protein [Kofleriaceae bacterium]